jgi:hypothetical protein
VTAASETSRPSRAATSLHRRWKQGLLRDLLAADGYPDPRRTAEVLTLLGDGLLVIGHLDRPPRFRELVRDTVTAILDAHRDSGT